MASLNRNKREKYRRRDYLFWVLLTILELAVSPLIAYGIHRVLEAVKNDALEAMTLTFNYRIALQQVIEQQQVRTWWCLLEMGYAVLSVFLLIDLRPGISRVDEMYVTDDIRIPVPAGNGQHGKERFLTAKEKEKLFELFLYSGKEGLKGKGGLVVQMTRRYGRERILFVKDDRHALIIGATRSGKTRRVLLETIGLQIMSGLSFVVSDVKGELFYYTSGYARKNGYKVLDIDLRNPAKSVHYNFLQPILDAFAAGDRAKAIDFTWDLVCVLVGEQKGEPIWYNGECASIAASILIVALEAPEKYRNLTNVYYFLAYMCESDEKGKSPLNDYLNELEDTHPAKGVFAMAQIAAIQTRSSFYTSALGTLRLFTNPNVAEMTSKSDFSLKDISSRKTAVYLMIPDEKKTLYPLVSIFVTQLYAKQVELANENGLRLPVDTDYDLDEVGNFPFIPVLGNILSAGASRGVRANLIIQDFQQLESKYKNDFKNIRTNCTVKVYLKSDDPDTLKYVSENAGKYTVEVSSASTSSQDGRKYQNVNYSSSASLTGRALLETAEVKRIKAPYSICMITGEYTGINILPDLSEYRMNKLFGLGNEKYNTRLIMKREEERKERDAPELELWGIWNQYRETEEQVPEERISFL